MKRKNIFLVLMVGGIIVLSYVESNPAPVGTQATFQPTLPLLHTEFPQTVSDLPSDLLRVDVIRIYGDYDLRSKAQTYGWEGSGDNATDPIVITGLNFSSVDGSYKDSDSLYLYNTKLHVRIEGNYFYNAKYGVRFASSTNIQITYNLFVDTYDAISKSDLEDATISISHNNFLNFTNSAVQLTWAYSGQSVVGSVNGVYLGYNNFVYNRTVFYTNLIDFFGNNSLVEYNQFSNTIILASGENYTLRNNVWYNQGGLYDWLAVRSLLNAHIYNNVMLGGRVLVEGTAPISYGGNVTIEDNYFINDQVMTFSASDNIIFRHNYIEIRNKIYMSGSNTIFENNTVIFSGAWNIEVPGNNNTLTFNAVVNERSTIVPIISDTGTGNIISNNAFTADDPDSDGLSTYAEVMAYHTDPFNPDTDGDGIPDPEDPVHVTVISTVVSTVTDTTTDTVTDTTTVTVTNTTTDTVTDTTTETVTKTESHGNETIETSTETVTWIDTETVSIVSNVTLTIGNQTLSTSISAPVPVPLSQPFVVLGIFVGAIIIRGRRQK